MNQMNLITEIYLHQRQQEILNEIAAYRQSREAMDERRAGAHPQAKFMLWLGKQLRTTGLRLEQHYSGQARGITPRLHHSDQADSA